MNVDLELIIFIFSLIGTFASMVWKLADFKEKTYDYIDSKIRAIEDKQNTINHEFDITIRENKYQTDKDILTINGKIDKSLHKADRLENAISDVNRYLEKTGDFQARRGLNSQD